MIKAKKEKEEMLEEIEEELDEKTEEEIAKCEPSEEEKEKLKKLRMEELEELFASKSRGINPTTLGKFLSSKNQVALEKRDIAPQANLEEELKEVPIKEEKKEIAYNVYSPNDTSKYSGEPGNVTYLENSDKFLKEMEENKFKSKIEIIRAEEKKFTRDNFGSTTFGAKEKSNLEDQYLFRETKDPKKEYKPNIKIN